MLRVCLCVAILGLAAGCGGDDGAIALPKTVPAAGLVTLDGQPAANAMVTFIPRGETKGIECVGVTDATGDYKMQQVRGSEGVPPGEYSVVINRYVKPDGTPVALTGGEPPANLGAVESLPGHYSNPAETVLHASVPENGGAFNFELKSTF